jgi:hypothetical protein
MDDETTIFGNPGLPFFDFGIVKFFNPSTLQAYQMVVVGGAGKFKNSFSPFKMVALQQASLLELGEHAIYGCETDVFSLTDECLVDIFRGQMAHGTAFK